MNYLLGSVRHAVDSKGRIAIPLRFRSMFTDGDVSRATIIDGLGDRCLFAYPAHRFEPLLRYLSAHQFDNKNIREIVRRISAFGSTVELDAQGRVPLSDTQRRLIGLQNEVLLLGAGDRLEIWRPDEFERRETPQDFASIMEGIMGEAQSAVSDDERHGSSK